MNTVKMNLFRKDGSGWGEGSGSCYVKKMQKSVLLKMSFQCRDDLKMVALVKSLV